MKDLLNSDESITLERLREFFHENDFSTMPVKDPSEYNEDEAELYKRRMAGNLKVAWAESPARVLLKGFPSRTYQG